MLWLKRNLFLAVSGLVAALLMGGSLFYLWRGISQNKSVEEEYESMKTQLDRLYNANPFPASSNIATGRQEVERMRKAVGEAKQFFAPIAAEQVSGLAFKTLLDQTIFELTQKARQSSISLPGEDYAFSFASQKEKLNLNPECFPAITEQLAEVKTLCNILFDARIHGLVSLKRARLTSDDEGIRDYSDDLKIETNAATAAVLSPYEVTFVGFSTELASVLDAFVRSPHGFLIKAVRVDRYEEAEEQPASAPGLIPVPRGPKPVAPAAPPAENQTVLNEERFMTTLLLTVVKSTS